MTNMSNQQAKPTEKSIGNDELPPHPPPPRIHPPNLSKKEVLRGGRKESQTEVLDRSIDGESISTYTRNGYSLLIHIVTMAIYVLPIFTSSTNGTRSPGPVLDEIHIMSPDNHDVNGETTLRQIFTNDYWGRPLNAHNSHKSWRPLSILLFRYVGDKNLNLHRMVNIVTHASTAELVGILALRLLCWDNPPPSELLLLRVLAKFAFALHPSHVEVTANAANRPHLLAVMCSLLASDPHTHPLVFIFVVTAGYLSCETFIFQVIPSVVTVLAIAYLKRYRLTNHSSDKGFLYQLFMTTVQPNVLWRILWLVFSATAYYAGRWYYDTLSIPEGLIRPAENPFFELKGYTRFWSYAMVIAIHVAKQWDWDYIGPSHEYGFECVSVVQHWNDSRLIPMAVILVIHTMVGLHLLWQQRRRTTLSRGIVLFAVYTAWTFTLFPITGILKVGTFISDRIVVAATVPVAILQAHVATCWILQSGRTWRRFRWFLLVLFAALVWSRVYQRSQEWMDPRPLLESSLRTCPQFAKAHLEMSKIYSGLYIENFNLSKAKWHLKRVEKIDPNFCDVHQQFAHVSAQEGKFQEFEERTLQALLCPYTMSGAIVMWQKYWNAQLNPAMHSTSEIEDAQRRYLEYQLVINKAIEEGAAKEAQQEKRKSPLAVEWNRKGEL